MFVSSAIAMKIRNTSAATLRERPVARRLIPRPSLL
jgi:hypothetical protein